MEIAKNKSSNEWFKLIDDYYDKETLARVKQIKQELDKTQKELSDSIKEYIIAIKEPENEA